MCAFYAFITAKRVSARSVNQVNQELNKHAVFSLYKSGGFIAVGLFLTVCADYFILIKGQNLMGVILFCSVQIAYLTGLRINAAGSVAMTAFLSVLLGLTISYLGVKMDLLLAVSLFYFVLISKNTIYAISAAVSCRKKELVIFAVGMVLFLCCDINVAIFNMADYIELLEGAGLFMKISTVAMWFFYLPSQILIAVSIFLSDGKLSKNTDLKESLVRYEEDRARRFLKQL